MEEAIKKINDEMQKYPGDMYTEIIGHYLIDRASAEPEVAGQILKAEKTLARSLEAVKAAAQKIKKGEVAVLTPAQVFGEIDRYFGLTPNVAAQYKSMGMDEAARQQEPPLTVVKGGRPARGKVNIDLDDFL